MYNQLAMDAFVYPSYEVFSSDKELYQVCTVCEYYTNVDLLLLDMRIIGEIIQAACNHKIFSICKKKPTVPNLQHLRKANAQFWCGMFY